MSELRDLLRKAVEGTTDPAIKTAVLLSGGIDSSTVASLAPRLPVITGYYEGDAYDERRYARLVSKGRKRHEFLIGPEDFVDRFDQMLTAVEPPFAGPGTFGQYMVAWSARLSGFTRLLSGEGGDELFGGYARLHIVAGHKPPDGYEDYQLPDDYPRDLEAALAYDWERLPDLLRVDEQVTSAHGITAIAPMLDERVVEYVLAQSPEFRVGKRMLKEAMRGLVPDQILGRTDKRGFPVPFVEWAQREPVRSFVQERIGYVPDLAKPWDRQWWLDLCEASQPAAYEMAL